MYGSMTGAGSRPPSRSRRDGRASPAQLGGEQGQVEGRVVRHDRDARLPVGDEDVGDGVGDLVGRSALGHGTGVGDAVHRHRLLRDLHARVGEPFPVSDRLPVLDLDDRARDDTRLARVRPGGLQVEADQQLPVPTHAGPPSWWCFPPVTTTIAWATDNPRTAFRRAPRHPATALVATRATAGATVPFTARFTARFMTPVVSPPTPLRTPRGRCRKARLRRSRAP